MEASWYRVPVFDSDRGDYMPGEMNRVHFSSATDQHNTPKNLVDRISQFMGGIELDPCTGANNPCGAKRFFTEADNGLAQSWIAKTVYMNPPYGREIGIWATKLREEYRQGHFYEAITLLPARTDTKWWFMLADFPVCFIAGRLRFNDCDQSAPFPSALIYLGGCPSLFCERFQEIGQVYRPVERVK